MSKDFALIIMVAKQAVSVKLCLQQAQPLAAYSSYFLTLRISLIDWVPSLSLTLIGTLMTRGEENSKRTQDILWYSGSVFVLKLCVYECISCRSGIKAALENIH